MAENRGGAGRGQGRKPKADKYKRDIVAAEKQIRDRLPDIVAAQIKLALGIMVEREDKDGNLEVFSIAPDVKAGQYLIDRILGKPTQKQEVTGEGGLPLQITISYEGDSEQTS